MPTLASGNSAVWLNWTKVPWLTTSDAAGRLVPLVDRMLAEAFSVASLSEFFRAQLPEIATEFAAPYMAVMQRRPDWGVLVQHGRHSLGELPLAVLSEVLDRDSGVALTFAEHAGWKLVAVPIPQAELPSAVLVAAGRSLPDDVLPAMLLLVRGLAHGVAVVSAKQQQQARIEQLRSTLKIASMLATVHETEPLLETIAGEAIRLLACDRASIFIWDKEHHELVARPAIGVPGNVLRIPDRTGVVGEVIHSGQLLRIDDAYADSRFSQKVDSSSGYKTRNLLCIPLRDSAGKLFGAFEVINKLEGAFTTIDEVTLVDLGGQVATALQSTRERELLVRSNQQLTEQVTKGVSIIGQSPPIVALRSTIKRLANTDLPVLILGESGTGKEVVAQALHYQGPRSQRPFVAVNCAAIAETLLESELFGHEKGAFTDAHDLRQGKFELAEGGTLFLDEVGDMSPGGQAKLLRVLEQKVITRVGGSITIPINTRVIAATNANLAEAVRAKRFREDLYFRLNVVTLDLPPLRDRPDDVMPLAEYFLSNFSTQARRPKLPLSDEARKRMQAHNWPGNVRELRNLMERVAFLAPGESVEAEDLAFILDPDRGGSPEPSLETGLAEATNHFQQEFIRRAIKRMRNNMSEAARLLGLHRSNLYRKMRQLGMTEAGDGLEGDD